MEQAAIRAFVGSNPAAVKLRIHSETNVASRPPRIPECHSVWYDKNVEVDMNLHELLF